MYLTLNPSTVGLESAFAIYAHIRGSEAEKIIRFRNWMEHVARYEMTPNQHRPIWESWEFWFDLQVKTPRATRLQLYINESDQSLRCLNEVIRRFGAGRRVRQKALRAWIERNARDWLGHLLAPQTGNMSDTTCSNQVGDKNTQPISAAILDQSKPATNNLSTLEEEFQL